MHNYPRNSPHAAARLISLMLIADGHVSRAEWDTLQRLKVEEELGLPPGGLHLVLQTFCEDLLCSSTQAGSMGKSLQAEWLDSLFRDIDDPQLRNKVLHYVVATAVADGHFSAEEQEVLLGMMSQWRSPDTQVASSRLPQQR
jgi:uncharacterized tellurite resistance protein B-like protein